VLTARGHTGRLTSGQGWPWTPTAPIDTREEKIANSLVIFEHGQNIVGNRTAARLVGQQNSTALALGPPEKVFNELWNPSRSRFGARRGRKVLDDHKAVDLSLEVGI
jgi:hypothetical protein